MRNKVIWAIVVAVMVIGLVISSYQLGIRQGQQAVALDTIIEAPSVTEQSETANLATDITDLTSVSELRGLFQHAAGKPRLILLLSPT